MDAAGDPDRLSALPDELLHLILGFLPEATAAARTAVLSRRWRHVWVHARNLVLSDAAPTTNVGRVGCRATPGYFAGFVDRLFARRGDDAGIGSLQISLYNHHCTPPEKVGEWTRYAVQHAADSFVLRIAREPTAIIIELPSHGRTASIKLNLSGSILRLPIPTAAASTYDALTELVLDWPLLGGGGRALGDFASSCCPRLRKLDIGSPRGLRELLLRADALEELHLYHADDLRALDVTAPNLRVLVVDRCFHREPGHDVLARRVARVVAPRLEAIGMRDAPLCKHPYLDIHGLTGVRRLDNLYLDMTGRCYRDTSAGVWLLENCPGVEHVEVSLDHECVEFLLLPGDEALDLSEFWTAGDLIDLAPEGAAPFASVKSLKVNTSSYFPQNHLVASISSLLLRCPRLTTLSISKRPVSGCPCFYGDSANHRKISLGSLEEVEISGFTGAKEDMDLVRLLFESSSSIKRMALLTRAAKILGSKPWKVTVPPSWMMDEVDPLVDEKLKSVTCSTGQGRWNITKEEEGVYTWTYQSNRGAG